MIPRYSRPQMQAVWAEENKLAKWLEIEILAAEAQAELGKIPAEAAANIRKKARFDAARVAEIESEVHHDVIAFLTNVGEHVGEDSKYIHLGLTSSDVLDTGLALQMRDATEILSHDVIELIDVLATRAREHKDTLMVGRTHGVHAEPTTFGLRLLGWAFEMKRNLKRLGRAKEIISYGKISGPVGTYASVDPSVETHVCASLGLRPASVSTQVLQRDRHAEYMSTLAIIASSLDKFATEIRNLQRTEIREVEEPFGAAQKGSSAMPHKKNPILCERVSGLARVVRGNALAALENVVLWHERDISHSSAERVIIPDSTILLDYMLAKFTEVMRGLVVSPDRMMANLELTGGLVFSQRVMLALVGAGMLREDAYRIVQKHAMDVWEGKGDLKTALAGDPEVTDRLPAEKMEDLFDYGFYVKHVDAVFGRLETS